MAQFEALLQAARAAARGRLWDPAAADASEALRLWRGEPLADVDSDVLADRLGGGRNPATQSPGIRVIEGPLHGGQGARPPRPFARRR
jgi:hypothetical protein